MKTKPTTRILISPRCLAAAVTAITFCVLLSSCETTDQDKVAQAQQCLDRLGMNAQPGDPNPCLQEINGVTSQESYVVRCSADFINGGINDTSLINAYNAIKGKSGNQIASYLMADLIQTSSGVTAANLALTTYNDCVSSGVSSLIYLAGLSYTGTELSAGDGGQQNPTTLISDCTTTPSNCNPTTIGTIAPVVESTYCTGSNETSAVCTTLNTAIVNGNGNPTAIGTALINLLQQ